MSFDAQHATCHTLLNMWAAIRGDVETMRRLIAFGADANAADDAGYTPLLHVNLRATLARARHWCAPSRCRRGRGEPRRSADVGGTSQVPVQMWHGAGGQFRSVSDVAHGQGPVAARRRPPMPAGSWRLPGSFQRDWAHPCHICTGTGLTPPPAHICTGTARTSACHRLAFKLLMDSGAHTGARNRDGARPPNQSIPVQT
jgi:hypothetical protein